MEERIIVYIDDAEYAHEQIAPLRSTDASGPAAGVVPLAGDEAPRTTHWILVACPPHLPGGTGKWVTHEALEGWRRDWAGQLFDEVRPLFDPSTEKLTHVLATGELTQLTERLKAEHGPARVLDARQPKFGVDLAPVSAGQKTRSQAWKWQIPAALAGLGALLALGAE